MPRTQTDTRFEVFKKHLPYFVEQMADPHNHVTLYQLWIEYKANNPDGYVRWSNPLGQFF